ncbi:hypothetical protein HYN59_16900 [Flavobacterium album]|uniref:DKNYY family protein n=1 Tax=Flavobacterium album TaxID=2175091 RepID=A0A2S1R276_9FLAO|nr:DKNYY domain-containing protein [Flavobacterium album]AWH86679.1 hypothetical protein HYN59_16900 [Flavobacterium album]
MKKLLPLLLLLTFGSTQAQTLIQGFSQCTYLESPLYIINDNSIIYQDCKVRKIVYADRATFRQPKYNEIGVAMDKNGIYFQGTFMAIDTTGFQVVGRNNNYGGYTWLWKTRNKAYCNLDEITGVDVATFSAIECQNGQYFKDKNSIYYFETKFVKIEGSDGASVNKTCSGWVYDKNYVYAEGKPLLYNGKKLKPVNESLAKTASAVVNRQLQPIAGMDAATIKGLSRSYSMDKNFVYWHNEKTPIKPASFKNVKVWDQVNRAYVSDGIHVYAGAKMLEKDFDAKTFGMLPHSDFCYDKNGVYERQWIEAKEIVINAKFPFNYTTPVSKANMFITDNSRYIVYNDQAYDPWDKKLYKNLTLEQVSLLNQGKLELNDVHSNTSPVTWINQVFYIQDNIITWRNAGKVQQFKEIDAASFSILNYNIVKDKSHVYNLYPKLTVLPIDAATATVLQGGFIKDRDSVYFNDKKLLSSKDVELLAIFPGYRMGCSQDTRYPSDYYFFRNTEGYYLIETTHPEFTVKFLGKEFKESWDPKLVGFVLE